MPNYILLILLEKDKSIMELALTIKWLQRCSTQEYRFFYQIDKLFKNAT